MRKKILDMEAEGQSPVGRPRKTWEKHVDEH